MQLHDPQLLKQQAWLEGRWTGADDGNVNLAWRQISLASQLQCR